LKVLAERMSLYMQLYTLYSHVRPFGCSVIFAGIDSSGPQLYMIEPSGVCYVCQFVFFFQFENKNKDSFKRI
jgi:20S proteasome subunit alpha 7